MHTQFLAGFLAAFVVSFIGIGTSFCLQTLIARDSAKLSFGVHSVALGVSAGAFALARAPGFAESYWVWTIGAGAELVAVLLMLQFAMLFSRPGKPPGLPRGVFGVLGGLEVINLGRGLVRPMGGASGVWSGWALGWASGWAPAHAVVRVSAFGALAWLLASGAFCMTAVQLGGTVRSGRREAMGPFIGSLVALGSWGRDGLIAMGALDGLCLGPLGSAVLVVSVADAYLFRHARLSRDLARDYAELRGAQRELRRKEQLTAIGELAAVVAHEIRNPLAILSNSIAGLRRRNLPDAEKDTLLAILGEESSRLNRLVSDLLTYARPIALRPQSASIHEVLDRTMLSTASKGRLEFDVAADPGADRICADPSLLRHVLENLLDNAGQAMNWTGTVQIAVRAARRGQVGGVTISVCDRGEGMDEEVFARARSPFFTTRPTGTGLGLAIVDRIVDAHGGEFTIESQVGVGTTATVFFPDPPAAAGSASPNPSPSRAKPDVTHGESPLPLASKSSLSGRSD